MNSNVGTVRLALFLMGLAVWLFGLRNDDARLRAIGIAFFAAGFLLRFLDAGRRRMRKPDDDASGGTGEDHPR